MNAVYLSAHSDTQVLFNETIGYKLSGNYFRGDDWEEGRSKEDVEGAGGLIFDTYRARWRISPSIIVQYEDTTAIIASGFTQATGIEAHRNWGQAKPKTGRMVTSKDALFTKTSSRKPSGIGAMLAIPMSCGAAIQLLTIPICMSVRFSTAIVWGERQRFTYGLDVLLTRPDTEGGQSTASMKPMTTLTRSVPICRSETAGPSAVKSSSLRGGLMTIINLKTTSFHRVSPLAFQPNDDHNLRVTYNRAFNTPRTSDLFLDILSAKDAFSVRC